MAVVQRIVLLIAALALLSCAPGRFTATADPGGAHQRPPFFVEVFASDASFDSYREIGMLEVQAQSFAEANLRLQELGGANGCHAVRLVATHPSPPRGRLRRSRRRRADTTYVGSCMVPRAR